MGRTVINETENKQTIILNDSTEGVEGGYFDSEEVWHEFGGGGGETPSIQPTLTITVVNNISSDYDVTPNDDAFLKVENNHLRHYGGIQEKVAYGESKEFVTLLSYSNSYASFTPFVINYSLQVGDGATFTVTNLTNCTYQNDGGDGLIFVTDPTTEASCTITYTLA